MASGTIQTKGWKYLSSMMEGQYLQIPNDACEIMCMEFSNIYNSYAGIIALTPFDSVTPNSYFRFGGMTIHLDTSGGNLRVSQDGMRGEDGTSFIAPVYVYYR